MQTWTATMEISVLVSLEDKNQSTLRTGCNTLGHITNECVIQSQRHLLNHVHCCSSHNIQKFETTYMSLNRRMNKESVVHLQSELLLSCKINEIHR